MGSYEETDKLIGDLCDWMAEEGVDVRSNTYLRLVKSPRPEEGRCVLATRDIEFNAELVQIPGKFILNFRFLLEDAALVKFIEWAVLARGHKLTRLDGIYLYLIVQRVQGEQESASSRLAKFVASMPKSYDTPEYFAAELVRALPSCLRLDAVKRIERLKAKFELFERLLKDYVAATPGGQADSVSLLAERLDLELLRWAFCAVNSRCFHIDETDICSAEELAIGNRLFGELKLPSAETPPATRLKDYQLQKDQEEVVRNNLCCMIPYLDFLNHSFKSNACGYYDKDLNVFSLRSIDVTESAGDVQHAVASGQQVYITYGHHDNKTLLLEYGFIVDDNGNDRIDFSPTSDLSALLLQHADQDLDRFEATLIGENYLSDLSCNKFAGPSWFLLKALDLVCSLNDAHQTTSQPQTKKKKKKKAKAQCNQDIDPNHIGTIGQLFGQLLETYRADLNESLKNLANLAKTSDVSAYHAGMSSKFCASYLEIVDFNLDLVKNHDKWLQLF